MNKMKYNLSGIFIIAIFISISSCQKDPGQGGSASIIGYVHATVINSVNYFDTITTQNGFNEEVFIVYGGGQGLHRVGFFCRIWYDCSCSIAIECRRRRREEIPAG